MNEIKVNSEEVIQKNANTSSYTKDVNSMTFVHFPMLFQEKKNHELEGLLRNLETVL